MGNVLQGLEPANVFSYFEELTKIPHGSYHCKEISDYIVQFAKDLGLCVRQDDLYNVVIIKEKSADYPSDETVMIQGHLDMVCEKESDNPIDMTKDPLSIAIDGDWIHADRTTLGGDDGIAVAYAMAILADNSLAHPRLEVVLTTEEETGMEGATALDTSDLKARYMINIDSEEEGYLLTSCAGGNKSTVHLPIYWEVMDGIVCTLKVNGCQGGHSGAEIDKGRANANVVLGRVLHSLAPMHMRVVSLNGGLKDNAIPRDSEAVLLFSASHAVRAAEKVEELNELIRNEFRITDPAITIAFTTGTAQEDVSVMSVESSEKAIMFLFHSINGIQTMSFDIKGLVESSLNLGIMQTKEEELIFSYAIRSSKASLKYYMTDRMNSLAKVLGGHLTVSGAYPAWEYRPGSKLQELCKDKYKEMTGKDAEICAIHAGVECGLFASKMGEMDMISIGPDMQDIHTPKEKLSISSTKRTWDFLLAVLKDFHQYC